MDTTTVLIVGAGPTGLTLGVELARAGVPFRIVEAAPGPQPGSRGKGIQPRTLELFEDLGVAEQVLAHGQLAMPMDMTLPDGTVRRGGAAPAELVDRPDIPYPTSLIIPEWRVEAILRARLEELGGTVEFGTALVGYTQDADGVVATVTRAEPDTEQAIAARWIIGCDGGHSVVRKQAGIGFVGETLEDVRMIVADVAVDGLARDAWAMWRHPEGMVSLCPLPDTDEFQFQASIAPGQDPSLALDNVRAILERRTGHTDIVLHEPSWRTLWRANIRLVERYRDGAVFLAGDAAHIHSPAGGQGMNTGIQDAVNLGWKLAAVASGAPEALLDTYEAERRPVAEHVLALSNERLAATIRTNEVVTRRDASTTQLDVGYRGSVLARDDRSDDAVLRAGDRAPDATEVRVGERTGRLFGFLGGGRWTVLDLGVQASPIAFGPGVRVLRPVDTNGSLAAAYAPTDRTLVLLRPDGYIAGISDAGDPAVVLAALAAVVPTT